jgi:hypothetical protein
VDDRDASGKHAGESEHNMDWGVHSKINLPPMRRVTPTGEEVEAQTDQQAA